MKLDAASHCLTEGKVEKSKFYLRQASQDIEIRSVVHAKKLATLIESLSELRDTRDQASKRDTSSQQVSQNKIGFFSIKLKLDHINMDNILFSLYSMGSC